MLKNQSKFLGNNQTVYQGQAPARLDVMGGIADYSGSLVLQMPLQKHTKVFISRRTDKLVRIKSGALQTELDLSSILIKKGRIVQDKTWKAFDLPYWSLYILGCIFVVIDEYYVDCPGLNILVESDVPQGKGISSSAALEVAVMKALFQLFELTPTQKNIPVLAQRAENLVVEAPCGIMDQLAVYLGEQNALLPILCQPHTIYPLVDIPKNIHFVGIDTGVKHAVGGVVYPRVRTAAFMGWSIILQSLGTSIEEITAQRELFKTSLPYGGYLSNISPIEFEKRFAAILPETISGKDFIQQFTTTTDPLTIVEKDTIYAVHICTRHPVYENHRINRFYQALRTETFNRSLSGKWMIESHQSYRACGLSCPEADFIVDWVQSVGIKKECYGARITGGGSGGTVCILTSNTETIEEVCQVYKREFDYPPMVFGL